MLTFTDVFCYNFLIVTTSLTDVDASLTQCETIDCIINMDTASVRLILGVVAGVGQVEVQQILINWFLSLLS